MLQFLSFGCHAHLVFILKKEKNTYENNKILHVVSLVNIRLCTTQVKHVTPICYKADCLLNPTTTPLRSNLTALL